LPDLARRKIIVADTEIAEAELDRLDDLGARAVTLGESDYPAALAEIDDAPPVLSVLGDPTHLSRPGVGIVGARNASANGRRLAETLARDLADAGVPVISGLARGIDTAAHTGAIAGDGITVAAMAGGIDIVYPPENGDLYSRIARTGAAVSEMPPGTKPQARHFPRRNRIVSGLSLAVVVVEAAQRSGSLITARMAGEQGRDVLAVPGSPLDPRSYGANHLIREGASLVRDADDVLEAIRPMLDSPKGAEITAKAPHDKAAGDHEAGPVPGAPEHRDAVVNCLSPEPVAVDEIVRRCQLTAPVVRTILLELELAGRLERHPGNRVAAI
ncbi:MAG: DNA-protecting protein DprA, partial [Alphaproteobacteria bacterium]|nr:DNA-protecting protein DprA [Alphaproteobacteria bacterium]